MNIGFCFFNVFTNFGHLWYIGLDSTGDGMHNAFKVLRFRRFSRFLAFRSEVVFFWK